MDEHRDGLEHLKALTKARADQVIAPAALRPKFADALSLDTVIDVISHFCKCRGDSCTHKFSVVEIRSGIPFAF